MRTAVIIGRFQVPYLHLGHICLISHALQNYDKVIILLGTLPDNKIDDKNPFDFRHRFKCITDVFNPNRIGVTTLVDNPGNDKEWSDQIDEILVGYDDIVLLHSRDSFKDHYMGIHPTVEIPEVPGYSGTKLREQTTN